VLILLRVFNVRTHVLWSYIFSCSFFYS